MRFISAVRVPHSRLLSLPAAGWADRVRQIAAAPGPRLVAAVAALVCAAAIVGAVVVFAADRALSGHAEDRAGAEAASFAEHSGLLATGDAFAGYIHMLRAADDGEVRSTGTPSDRRTAALRRLLELNTNRFNGYAVVGLDGQLLAATDVSMVDGPASDAFVAVRANQGNANSDIVFGDAAAEPYVDYATILTDPATGPWAVLVARAGVERLWQPTLSASVDGGKNIIISRDGRVATGVPSGQVGAPWRGADFAGGSLRTGVPGADSVCGLHAVARDTKIDHGWNVASCLPAATVLGTGSSTLELGLIAFLAVLLVSALATATMFLLARGQRFPVGAPAPPVDEEAAVGVVEEPAPSVVLAPIANVDARTVIEAYEARNARLAAHIRESVQARLLVVSSRVEEALELRDDDPDLSRVMLERAAFELDDMNEHELRALGQELYPDLVRLGLPAALRALRKDIADIIEVEIDADSDADSLDDESVHAIDGSRRIVLYRLALEALQAFAGAGLDACTVSLKRTADTVWLAVKGHGHSGEPLGESMDASVVAIEAYGGSFTLDAAGDATEIAAELAPNDRPSTEPPKESVVDVDPLAGQPDEVDSEAA